jgi:hypothetical protein
MGTGQLLAVPRLPLCGGTTIDLSLFLTFPGHRMHFSRLRSALGVRRLTLGVRRSAGCDLTTGRTKNSARRGHGSPIAYPRWF